MHYDFDMLTDRRPTECYKWHAYEPDVLPMFVADMDFPSPEPVILALKERVTHGIFGYPKEPPELRQVVVDRLDRLYGWKIETCDLVFVPGVVTGFNLANRAYGTPGKGMLIQTPVYPPILSAPENAEMQPQINQLKPCSNGHYEIDLDRFQAAITDQTEIFLLCNPHNPIGRVFTKDELERMAQHCLSQRVLIVSDEIHCDLIFNGNHHIPIASLDPEIAQNSITLMAPSKTFNIAGLECSVAIIPNAELRRQYQHARKGLVGFVNILGLVAAYTAYQDGQEWLDQLLPYLQANRDFAYDYVVENFPGAVMDRPEGTYLAWLDFRNTHIKSNPYEFFLKNARVALNDGVPFGPGGEGFVRLNFGCPRSMLISALERMKKAFNNEPCVVDTNGQKW